MRLTHLQLLLINTSEFLSIGKESLKHSERLKRVISRNMFNTRQEHTKGSVEVSI